MTTALRVLLRVVMRRIECGETLEKVLADYPKISKSERTEIEQAIIR